MTVLKSIGILLGIDGENRSCFSLLRCTPSFQQVQSRIGPTTMYFGKKGEGMGMISWLVGLTDE